MKMLPMPSSSTQSGELNKSINKLNEDVPLKRMGRILKGLTVQKDKTGHLVGSKNVGR